MDFEKLCKVFMMQDPFYGIILSSLDRESCKPDFCPTMCVGKVGNIFKLWYNPDFVNAFSDESVLQFIKHECLHLCLFHHFVGKEAGIDKDADSHRLCNVAADFEVNSYLDRSKIDNNGKDFLWASDYGFPERLGMRKYFDLIKNDSRFAAPQKMQVKIGGNGTGSQGNSNGSQEGNTVEVNVYVGNDGKVHYSFDDHDKWSEDMTAAERAMIQQEIESMIAFAAAEVEKSQGNVPGEMAGIVEKIRKKPKPVADWRKYCRRFMGNEYTYLTKRSRRRESKRFPDAAGAKHLKKSRILVAIDTSGSVSMPEYKEFMGQILTMKDKANFRIVECDARIQNEYEFTGKIHEQLHGGGGTDFSPVVDMFIKHQREYDCLVYFTDGWCDIPKNTPKDTLWVISSKGDQTKEKYKVNGCSVVFIPKQEGK